VRLVDDEERDRAARERRPEGLRGEALGRGEADRRRPFADLLERCAVGFPVPARGEHHRRVAQVGQPRALVAHQRDQRGDDDGEVLAGERGELVAEALATAGGHDDERVAPVERRLDGLALAGAERAEAQEAQQRLGVGAGAARARSRPRPQWWRRRRRRRRGRPRRRRCVLLRLARQRVEVGELVVAGRAASRPDAVGGQPGQRRQRLALGRLEL
jgi:hypothetical protein